MLFTSLLGFSALLVAGCAAYFSVVGIATLFAGHFTQVLIMASSLEIGKIVATSFLYRYWNKTMWALKLYLIIAVITLVGITSMGIFGYLSSGYQVNRGKTEIIDTQTQLVTEQKTNIEKEIQQISKRIDTLNAARSNQEQRLPSMSRTAAAPVYEDIKRAGQEIQSLNQRVQDLRESLFQKDNEIIALKGKVYELHDIGTFKFVAEAFNTELDTVVKVFIVIIVLVFDPLAVALVLAYNVAVYGKMSKETLIKNDLTTSEPIPLTKYSVTPTPTVLSTQEAKLDINLSGHLKS